MDLAPSFVTNLENCHFEFDVYYGKWSLDFFFSVFAWTRVHFLRFRERYKLVHLSGENFNSLCLCTNIEGRELRSWFRADLHDVFGHHSDSVFQGLPLVAEPNSYNFSVVAELLSQGCYFVSWKRGFSLEMICDAFRSDLNTCMKNKLINENFWVLWKVVIKILCRNK